MPNTTKERPDVAEAPPSKRKLALYEQTLIALLLGIATGVFLGELAGVFKVVGDIFIRLLQVTVIPYISLSLITGLGSLSIDTVKRLAFKGGASRFRLSAGLSGQYGTSIPQLPDNVHPCFRVP